VLGNEESAGQDSFSAPEGASERSGLLDAPHYTRPAVFRDWPVPEVLLSGNHEEIRRWRRRKSLEKTWRRRPDLLARAALSAEDRKVLEEIQREVMEPAVRDWP
jgi:tRNA (guanine37-N1)-methyltransferase